MNSWSEPYIRAWWTNPSVAPELSPWERINASYPLLPPLTLVIRRFAPSGSPALQTGRQGVSSPNADEKTAVTGSADHVSARPRPRCRCRSGPGGNQGDGNRRLALSRWDRLVERLSVRDPVRLRSGEPRQRRGLHRQAGPVRPGPLLRHQPARGRGRRGPRRRVPPGVRE